MRINARKKICAQELVPIDHSEFTAVFPAIARQIIDFTGTRLGICLDIGCGGGYLGAALARSTQLYMRFFDSSEQMLAIARNTIANNGISDRADLLRGDISFIPMEDQSVDLAVSHESVFLWKDLAQAVREIYRVLAPRGWAYLSGGFGSATLRTVIEGQKHSRPNNNASGSIPVGRHLNMAAYSRFETAFKTAGIPIFAILQNEEIGLWIAFQK